MEARFGGVAARQLVVCATDKTFVVFERLSPASLNQRDILKLFFINFYPKNKTLKLIYVSMNVTFVS